MTHKLLPPKTWLFGITLLTLLAAPRPAHPTEELLEPIDESAVADEAATMSYPDDAGLHEPAAWFLSDLSPHNGVQVRDGRGRELWLQTSLDDVAEGAERAPAAPPPGTSFVPLPWPQVTSAPVAMLPGAPPREVAPLDARAVAMARQEPEVIRSVRDFAEYIDQRRFKVSTKTGAAFANIVLPSGDQGSAGTCGAFAYAATLTSKFLAGFAQQRAASRGLPADSAFSYNLRTGSKSSPAHVWLNIGRKAKSIEGLMAAASPVPTMAEQYCPYELYPARVRKTVRIVTIVDGKAKPVDEDRETTEHLVKLCGLRAPAPEYYRALAGKEDLRNPASLSVAAWASRWGRKGELIQEAATAEGQRLFVKKVIQALRAGKTLILALKVSESFMKGATSPTGWVEVTAPGRPMQNVASALGGVEHAYHAMQVIGYRMLKATHPLHAHFGGGYFVLNNSWGLRRPVLVPFSYFEKQGFQHLTDSDGNFIAVKESGLPGMPEHIAIAPGKRPPVGYALVKRDTGRFVGMAVEIAAATSYPAVGLPPFAVK